MAGTEAVVFDIGRVLLGWNPEAFYERLMPREARLRMFAETGIEAMNLGVDRGAPLLASVRDLAAKHPEWADMIVHWHDSWGEMIGPEIGHSVRLLHALKAKGVPVFALTNFGDETYDIARGRYPFLDDFDRAYVSARLRVIKPEARIYEIVEEDCGIPPSRLLFTDDKAENIDAAAARGWATHLFETPEGLAARLVAEGLLSVEEAA
ncbi:MAG: HAD family phosphatase [Paracoccaceae bacterium]